MGKVYTPSPIASEVNFKNTVNANFTDIETALQDVVSRSGATPNSMGADLDMDSNDILNVNRIDADEYYQNGQPLDFDSQLQEAKDYSDAQDVIQTAALQTYAENYTDTEIAALDIDSYLTKTADLVVDASTARTLTSADAGRIIWFSNASGVTVTLPQTSTEALPDGFQCVLIQGNTGVITVTEEGAEGIIAVDDLRDSSGQGAAISVLRQGSGVWWIGGGLA